MQTALLRLFEELKADLYADFCVHDTSRRGLASPQAKIDFSFTVGSQQVSACSIIIHTQLLSLRKSPALSLMARSRVLQTLYDIIDIIISCNLN